jgi:Tfp pilus assembly protein PilF
MKKLPTLIFAIFVLFLFVSLGSAAEKNIKPFAKDAVEKGWVYFNKGDLETAFKRFHQATIIDPEFAPGYFGKAYVYSVQNKLDLAIENYKKTIELAAPPFSPAYSNLGLALLMKGQNEEGHKMLLKALEIDPNNGDAHVNIAQSFCEQKQNKKAWEHIRYAQSLKARIDPGLLSEMQSECAENN